MRVRLVLGSLLVLMSALSTDARAERLEAKVLLERVLRPGAGVRGATIACDYTFRARPENRDVEAGARSLERRAIADGMRPEVAKSMAEASRRASELANRGVVRRARVVHRYDAKRWSVDEEGPGAMNGVRYREAWYANGREVYQLIRTPISSTVTITATDRSHGLPFGPALFFRRPQVASTIARWGLSPTGKDQARRWIFRGDVLGALASPDLMATVTLWVDARHGHWPARIEVRLGDTLIERCLATGFRQWPGGLWFPTRVEDATFDHGGSRSGEARARRVYTIRSARFNAAAGAGPSPPAIDRPTKVRDYRFSAPLLYTSDGEYRSSGAVQGEARQIVFRSGREAQLRRRTATVRFAAGFAMVAIALVMATTRRRRTDGGSEDA